MGWYTDMMNALSARQLIESIANEYVELSHDKVRWQRDDHIKICRAWLAANPDPVESNEPEDI
jgi:hypothetical protein